MYRGPRERTPGGASPGKGTLVDTQQAAPAIGKTTLVEQVSRDPRACQTGGRH
jgi:hypothetical protein